MTTPDQSSLACYKFRLRICLSKKYHHINNLNLLNDFITDVNTFYGFSISSLVSLDRETFVDNIMGASWTTTQLDHAFTFLFCNF